MTALPNVYDTNRWIVTVEEVHDGDTLHVLLNHGFDDYKKMTLRLDGIDADELETPTGDAAKQWLIDHLAYQPNNPMGQRMIVISTKKSFRDKYGRYLATLWNIQGVNLNQMMIDQGFAKEYHGGAR
jgi:micrococcal nuclease